MPGRPESKRAPSHRFLARTPSYCNGRLGMQSTNRPSAVLWVLATPAQTVESLKTAKGMMGDAVPSLDDLRNACECPQTHKKIVYGNEALPEDPLQPLPLHIEVPDVLHVVLPPGSSRRDAPIPVASHGRGPSAGGAGMTGPERAIACDIDAATNARTRIRSRLSPSGAARCAPSPSPSKEISAVTPQEAVDHAPNLHVCPRVVSHWPSACSSSSPG